MLSLRQPILSQKRNEEVSTTHYRKMNYKLSGTNNRKIKDIKKKIEKGFNSVPSTIRDELECNIFLRANDLASFSKLRYLKDNF